MNPFTLTFEADEDLQKIIEYTVTTWGVMQVRKYMQSLEQCMQDLANGDKPYRALEAVYPGVRMIHCQHHYIFGVKRESEPFLIVAIFHEKMDIMQRLKKRLNQ